MTAAAIAKQIHDGGQAMPAFGDQLTAAQIDDLVAYLRSKRKVVVAAGE
jgi:mono/diheme cytochrome c family protein